MQVEEDRLVHGAVLLLEELVFDRYGRAELVALFVDALQFNGDIAHLLRLVPADDGEFNVVPFAEAAELVDFVMVARDERPHFAASHLQIFTRGVQIGLHTDNLGVHGLDVVTGGLCGELRVY